MYFQIKTEILKGRRGSRLWNSEGMGGGEGVTHFGISEGRSRPWLGVDIFWNCPIVKLFLLFWSDLNGPYFR